MKVGFENRCLARMTDIAIPAVTIGVYGSGPSELASYSIQRRDLSPLRLTAGRQDRGRALAAEGVNFLLSSWS